MLGLHDTLESTSVKLTLTLEFIFLYEYENRKLWWSLADIPRFGCFCNENLSQRIEELSGTPKMLSYTLTEVQQ